MNRQILHGDAIHKLKEIGDNTIDLMATDPPYGYSFMNKNWDKAIISVEIWRECLRVLKAGAFAFVMSAPRQDVLSHMIVNLTDAGFVTNFTSIYWAYGVGFPKAANISKLVDKKLGKERKIISGSSKPDEYSGVFDQRSSKDRPILEASISNEAKKLDGSYAGFQPKPAVEVILVCMKPLSEKNYVEQAMSNGKGITWLDDCRIPFVDHKDMDNSKIGFKGKKYDMYINGTQGRDPTKTKPFLTNQNINQKGRFPANLLVSDDAVDIGKKTGAGITGSGIADQSNVKNKFAGIYNNGKTYKEKNHTVMGYNDTGDFSRYFDLDAWEAQFIITPKPSKSEKNKGLDNFIEQKVSDGRIIENDTAFQRGKTPRLNTHPTVKPVSLFKYLVTMGSREGDIILDPFMGSGTTAIACEQTARHWIGIEKIPEHIEIFKARLADYRKQNKLEEFL